MKYKACRAFYHFFTSFNKFNNTGARMLDSFYHMTLKFIKTHIFGMKTSSFSPLLRNVIIDFITSCYEICKPLVDY